MRQRLAVAAIELERVTFAGRRSSQPAATACSQHVLVERRAIDLKRRQPRLITRADLHAIVEWLIRAIRKPHPQPLLHELVMPEIIRSARGCAS